MFQKIFQLIRSIYPENRSMTVHVAFPFMFFGLLIFGAAATITQEDSFITIFTSPASVREGEIFFINVAVTANVPVNAVDVVIDYPEAQIEITGIDKGESVLTLWTEEPYAEDGKIYLSGGTFGKGFLGEHDIARVRAVAIESGTAYVSAESVQLIAGDGEGTEIEVGEDGVSRTKIYIANEDGSLVGTASIKIVTDVDGDGDVDLSDISVFMSAWFNKDAVFDFNGDGRMTFRDFSILLADSFLN